MRTALVLLLCLLALAPAWAQGGLGAPKTSPSSKPATAPKAAPKPQSPPATEPAEAAPVRALLDVHTTSHLRSTVLPGNQGWQPLYTLEVNAKAGDVFRIFGQTQLTVDTVPEVGQQLRLLLDGQPIGNGSIEINTQPGSHHLPMQAFALVMAEHDGPLTITLEGSAFHSDGDFPVTVDHQENLAYGSLLAEQYRSYPGLAEAWAAGAKLLTDIYQPQALSKEVWGQAPYVQEPLASLTFPANQGDILRPTAQAVAAGAFGLEQFTGVLTSGGQAISPYGGQNVDEQNPFAAMLLEGFQRVPADGEQFLEQRVYGAFGRGLTIEPASPSFEIAHFGMYGSELARFGQEHVQLDTFPSTGLPVEVYSQEIELLQGDLLRLTGSLQFGRPDTVDPVNVDCRLDLVVEGPGGSQTSFAQKTQTPTRNVLPLIDTMTFRAPESGLYRISMRATGSSPQGVVPLRLDTSQSQLQYLLYSLPI